ncbi:PfkB family carbohydrate kinase [Agrobacterium radiobacter]|uniref:PfkB family carbohydrate kinase n=1 Tax=Agrobacterium radiobacter TaxID=362 RepID=UPI003F8371BA
MTGSRVIYDPQSPHAPEAFTENGSAADELALVMNEQEFKAYSKSDDLDAGARDLMESRAANVVVVKRGVFGALIYSSIGAPVKIPIYQSSRVFKIGTGDVFSGVFAYFWAQERRNPIEAADLASRAVAIYCEAPVSPIDAAGLEGREPVKGNPPLAVDIYGAADTLGRRYTLQEALYCLRSLGVDASIAATALPGAGGRNNAVGLVIADGVSDESLSALNTVLGGIVVLNEEHRPLPPDIDRVRVSDDFASAIYQICMKRP